MQHDALLLARVHQELAVCIIVLSHQTISPMASTNPVLTADAAAPRMLRILEASTRVGLGRSSIWKMVKEGHFPAPRRLSRRSVGWLELDIEQWLRSRRSIR
jgi:prophage regulatory protein